MNKEDKSNKAIFWDSDGTLLYGNESFKESFIRACRSFGVEVPEDVARSIMREYCSWYVPDKDHSNLSGEEWWQDLLSKIGSRAEELGVTSDKSAFDRLFRKNVIDYEYRLYDDTIETLEYFKNLGYDNYIISNNFPELKLVFDRLGVGEYIEAVVTSAGTGYEKPRKEIYDYAYKLAGNPTIRYMIGDNPVVDYEGGLAAGMTPVLVHNRKDGCVSTDTLKGLTEIIR